jgi:hypothetical protein
MKRVLPLAALLVLGAAGCGFSRTATHTVTQTVTVTNTVTTAPSQASVDPCTGDDLKATFDVQEGSAGAGNVVYTLTLTNSSSSVCKVSGVPQVTLFDKDGNVLPTNATAEPGSTFEDVGLQPGASTAYDARFSPDVAGTGDTQGGKCQPTAATLRVTAAGGGNVDAPVSPPTPVCEQGSISLRPHS